VQNLIEGDELRGFIKGLLFREKVPLVLAHGITIDNELDNPPA
jgi:hypothetical protein